MRSAGASSASISFSSARLLSPRLRDVVLGGVFHVKEVGELIVQSRSEHEIVHLDRTLPARRHSCEEHLIDYRAFIAGLLDDPIP